MADAFPTYVQCVAAAGRAEYDIPLPVYRNVALCSEDPLPPDVPLNGHPGQYAPDIQFYAPGIYLQNYEIISEWFRHENIALFQDLCLSRGGTSTERDESGRHKELNSAGDRPFTIRDWLPTPPAHEASPF
ncbi:hypothetical protein BDW74DRAFT_174760 [Aspergillus multicolor]|uniref:uncharacterized protein n=1 Tax=Aspergillus multicolor TaxID=41759 RepID=UPI003CCD83C3